MINQYGQVEYDDESLRQEFTPIRRRAWLPDEVPPDELEEEVTE
jgi:hypothetical protein